MPESIEPKNVDKRIYDRYVQNGQVDEKAYDKHLKALPDVADKCVAVESTMASDDDVLANDEEAAEGPQA